MAISDDHSENGTLVAIIILSDADEQRNGSKAALLHNLSLTERQPNDNIKWQILPPATHKLQVQRTDK